MTYYSKKDLINNSTRKVNPIIIQVNINNMNTFRQITLTFNQTMLQLNPLPDNKF